jgi:predicted nucleic acid-binding protein
MKGRVFLDSNILVYSYSSTEIEKQQIARSLISANHSFISTQVLQELSNILTKKFKFEYAEAILAIEEGCQNNSLHTNTSKTIIKACSIADRYKFAFYDSLIISAALECKCDVLYSEDLTHGQQIDGTLVIKNPFDLLAVH